MIFNRSDIALEDLRTLSVAQNAHVGHTIFYRIEEDEAIDSGSCSRQMDVLLGKVRVLVLILLSRLAHALRPLRQWVLCGSTCQRQKVVAP